MSNSVDIDPLYETAVGDPIGTTDDGQPIIAEEGDGVLTGADCQQDRNSIETTMIPFYRANTTFHARDVDDEEKWDNLWEHHHEWKRDDIARRTHMDKIRLTQALADHLALSRNQRGRVVAIAANLDGRRFNRIGGLNALALGAIGYVGDQDADDFDDRIVGRDQFTQLCEQLDADGREACSKIKDICRGLSGIAASTA